MKYNQQCHNTESHLVNLKKHYSIYFHFLLNEIFHVSIFVPESIIVLLKYYVPQLMCHKASLPAIYIISRELSAGDAEFSNCFFRAHILIELNERQRC